MKRIIYKIRSVISRFFAVKAPKFDNQAGSYEFPDVVLNGPENPPPPPRPLISRNCKKYHVIYSVVVNKTEGKCQVKDKIKAIGQAIDQALDYFENHFQCKNPNCIRKEAEFIWVGTSCWKNPDAAIGAVELRFKCKVEL